MATESAKTGEISHTPGFLQAVVGANGDSGLVIDGQFVIGECFADIRGPNENAYDESMANARRLVACWKSFDGVPTDLIECLPKMGTATLPYRILQARGEVLALSIEAFLDPEGKPPAATGEWAEAVAALAAFRAPRKESEL